MGGFGSFTANSVNLALKMVKYPMVQFVGTGAYTVHLQGNMYTMAYKMSPELMCMFLEALWIGNSSKKRDPELSRT